MKILPTIGPETVKTKNLKFILNKTEMVRINSSHNTIDWHIKTIKKIKKINSNTVVLVDIPGVKPRTKNSTPIFIKKNKIITFKYGFKSKSNEILLTRPLPKKIRNKKFGIVFLIKFKKKYLIVKSEEKLLQGMFGFPTSDFFLINKTSDINLLKKKTINSWIKSNCLVNSYLELGTIKHNFSGFDLKLFIVKIESKKDKIVTNSGLWVEKDKFIDFPFSKLMSKITSEVIN